METTPYSFEFALAAELQQQSHDSVPEDFPEVFPFGDPRCGQEMELVRQDAEHAMLMLRSQSAPYAVLLASGIQCAGAPFEFDHMELYREIAATNHCFIVPIDMPALGGVEHFLFAVRMEELSGNNYFAQVGNYRSIND